MLLKVSSSETVGVSRSKVCVCVRACINAHMSDIVLSLQRIARIEDRRTRVDLREIFLTRFSRIADNTVNKEWFYDLPIFPQQPL